MTEKLLQVKSLVNNSILDFTILEFTTSKRRFNVCLRFTKKLLRDYGVIYYYKNNIDKICHKYNIDVNDYNTLNDFDVMPVNVNYNRETTKLQVYNQY